MRGELTVCVSFSRCIGSTANFNGELRQGELELREANHGKGPVVIGQSM
jgi:hypothetical protein